MTIVFSNSSPKLTKSDVFGSKFKDFYFCTKLCNKDKFESADTVVNYINKGRCECKTRQGSAMNKKQKKQMFLLQYCFRRFMRMIYNVISLISQMK